MLKADLRGGLPHLSSINKFTPQVFSEICESERYRYLPASKRVSHILETKYKTGSVYSQSHLFPDDDTPSNLSYLAKPRNEIKNGRSYLCATDQHGTDFVGRRNIIFNTDGLEHVIHFMSPKTKKTFFPPKEQELHIFDSKLDEQTKYEIKQEVMEIEPVVKGGEMSIVNADVQVRSDSKRAVSQNAVMGLSAKDEYEALLESRDGELSSQFQLILTRAVEAEFTNAFENHKRPEWLHALGFSLTPLSTDPQVKENLGAAPKWANTEMMISERTAKWFAFNEPTVESKVSAKFNMLLDTEIIQDINFQISISSGDRHIETKQYINPLKKYPLYSKATDTAQTTMLTYTYLMQPEKILKVPEDVNDLQNDSSRRELLFSSDSAKLKTKKKKRKRVAEVDM